MERKVREIDNRDSGTTWLWISPDEYVEVRIGEILDNVHANMIDEHGQIDPEEVELAAAIERVCELLGVPGYEFS
jgi:hypothetical protein